MSTTREDIERFRDFATSRLASGGGDFDLVELAAEWQFRHDSVEHLESDALAVQAALRTMDAGETGRPLNEFAELFRQRNQISSDS